MPAQAALLIGAISDQVVVMVEQQANLQRPLIQVRPRQPLDAFAQRRPSDRGRIDADRTCRARARSGARPPSASAPPAPCARRARPVRTPTAQTRAGSPGSPTRAHQPSARAHPQRPLGPRTRRRHRQRAAQLTRRRVDRGKRVAALVGVRTNHDHPHRPLVDETRRSGPPADTPQSGRCHAPIKSRRRSSNRRRATQRMKVRPTGRHRPYESARRRPRSLHRRSDDTVRDADALTEATLTMPRGWGGCVLPSSSVAGYLWDERRGSPRGRGGEADGNVDGRGGVVPQSVRDRDRRLRGLGGDVPALRAVRRGAARARRRPAVVLELDALPAADAGVRRGLDRRPVLRARRMAEPRVRRPARDGDRLSRRQLLHLHLGQPGHRPGEDRRARRVLPEARRPLLRQLGRAVRASGGRRWRRCWPNCRRSRFRRCPSTSRTRMVFGDDDSTFYKVLDALLAARCGCRRRCGSTTSSSCCSGTARI